jgi:hypothetical protein
LVLVLNSTSTSSTTSTTRCIGCRIWVFAVFASWGASGVEFIVVCIPLCICQCLFCIRPSQYVILEYHRIFVHETLIFHTCCQFRFPGPLQWRLTSSSRSGCTKFSPEICDVHACLVISSVWIHFEKCLFSLISMFWPVPDLLVPTMTSTWKNQYRQPRSRVPSSTPDAVYLRSKHFLFKVHVLQLNK